MGRPSALYAAAIAVQMQWQSMIVAMIPPFRTCGGAAAWCAPGCQVQTDSSPRQKLLTCNPASLLGLQPQQWLPEALSWKYCSLI